MSQKKPPVEEGAQVAATFEAALARLEAVVQELEGKDLTLEETLARYEEGSRLVRECSQRLEEAEQRIRVLSPSATEEVSGIEELEENEGTSEADNDLPF